MRRGRSSLTLDLKEVRLVDRDVIGVVAGCKARGANIANCTAYIQKRVESKVMKRRINAITQLLDKILRFLFHGLQRSGGDRRERTEV